MRRRRLLRTVGFATAVGVTGCVGNGDEDGENGEGDGDGNETDNGENGSGDGNGENGDGGNGEENGEYGDVGRTDTGEGDGFEWEFEITRLEAGNEVDNFDTDFDQDENTVVVEGTTYGSDLCRTAELGNTDYDAEERTLDVSVVTRDVEGAGDVCAEAIREIGYVITFEFEDEIPQSVSVSHDGRGIGSAGWDSASESVGPPENESRSQD